MPRTPAPRAVLALGLAFAVPLAAQTLHRDGFEDEVQAGGGDAQSSRFLQQATFGATGAGIAALRTQSPQDWIAAQQALSPTRLLTYMRTQAGVSNPTAPIDFQYLPEAWFDRALRADDQLRQRVAFALSQIMVVSERGNNLGNDGLALGSYYDLLLKNAFGNYRTLLEDVTLSPAMGRFLSMYRNQKPDPANNIRPDENFAREVLQLFSIGLVQLNADGTPVLVGGQTVPTYDEAVVRGFAHAFTGWNCSAFPFENAQATCSTDGPMQPYENYHDTGAKQLFPGTTLAANRTAREDLAGALDAIFQHPNVGPFIGKQLIQKLVTSNPTPAYVGRVSAVFADNGNGVRGDLGAMVRAILLDPEARSGEPAARFGKVREPLLRLTQVLRALEVTWDDNRMLLDDLDIHLKYNQLPLGAPSVFNFFAPGYTPGGAVAQMGMVAPELQAITDTFAISLTNDLWGRIHYSCNGCPMDLFDDRVRVTQLDSWRAMSGNTRAMLERADVLFLGGTMSPTLRNQVRARLAQVNESELKVHNLLYLVTASPEFAVQR